MTAEVAVMNKYGIALAADSAASIVMKRNTKIYNANKLFMLSKCRPVGVMLYGSAEFMSVPWETIIKIHRKELGDRPFKTLQEYGSNFLSFLNNNDFLFPPKAQEDYVYSISYIGCAEIKKIIDNKVEMATHRGVKISASKINQIVGQTIKTTAKFVGGLARLPTLPLKFEKDAFVKYHKAIESAVNDVFKKQRLSLEARKLLRRISIGLFVKDTFDVTDTSRRQLLSSSGIVIAGFGEDDLYPSLVSYEIEGVINNTVKYKEGSKVSITTESGSALVPFAQKEMVHSFMRGIEPDYAEALSGFLDEFIAEYATETAKKVPRLRPKAKAQLIDELKKEGAALVAAFWDKANKRMQKTNVFPVLRSVAFLPIDELASMAESLVNLTSFKRRVTLDVAETVGGPIDVAVISKGDGFIWINRKHYFEAGKNPHFFRNYDR